MSDPDLLEVIDPSGQIRFVNLSGGKGRCTLRIGQSAGNDVVLNNAQVPPFYATLDYAQKPYRVSVTKAPVQASLAGRPLPPNESLEFNYGDVIDVAGYQLILLQGGTSTEPMLSSSTPLAPSVTGQPVAVPVTVQSSPIQMETMIGATLSASEWTIDAGGMATCELEITNKGELVAAFDVRVQGLEPGWCTLSTTVVRANEHGRGQCSITLMPPRARTTLAGAHRFSIEVTSATYPGQVQCLYATLNIKPFYDFKVDTLVPQHLYVTWWKHTGLTTLAITNLSNGEAAYTVKAEDTENACVFKLRTPDGGSPQEDKAILRIPPDGGASIPIEITPRPRPLLASGAHNYSITVDILSQEASELSRQLTGQVTSSPLISTAWLAVMVGILVLLAAFVLPRIIQPATPATPNHNYTPSPLQTPLVTSPSEPTAISQPSPVQQSTVEVLPATEPSPSVEPSVTTSPSPTTEPPVIVDPPIIQGFNVTKDPADPAAQVVLVAGNDLPANTSRFQVKFGSHIVLNWATINAQMVMLVGYGSQPVNGSTSPIVITQSQQFELQAINVSPPAVTSTVSAFVLVELMPISAPPAPFNIHTSDETTKTVTLNWDYDPAHIGDVVGFRVYRAQLGSSDYALIGSELTLLPATRSFADSAAQMCGKQYYVSAIFQDTNGNLKESPAPIPAASTKKCLLIPRVTIIARPTVLIHPTVLVLPTAHP